jgi:hypothetical protein
MNLYAVMLFIHVTGDIGIFVGLGAWLLGFAALRRAQDVSQVRALAALIHRTEPLSVVSSLVTIASGLYLLLTVWGWQTAWALVALGSLLVCLPPLLLGVIEPRMKKLLRLAGEMPDGQVPARLWMVIRDPLLGTALHTMTAVVVGIVFLMTTKPALSGAITAMAVAVTLGAVLGLLLMRGSGSAPDPTHPRRSAG